MISKGSTVKSLALRRAPRFIQDATRESQPGALTQVAPRPPLCVSSASGPFGYRFASVSAKKSNSKPTVPRAPTGSPTPGPTASAAAADAAPRLAPKSSSTRATYAAYGATKKLFEVCSAQAEYKTARESQKNAEVPKNANGEEIGVGDGWWYKDIGLLPTFSSWSQVTLLHMYLLTVRIRSFSSNESVQQYSQNLVDHFSHEAERRMDVMHGITQRSIRVKYLKDLFLQWRGILAAYDEGLVKGDAVLGAAVWRNLFKGEATGPDGEELDWARIAQVVAYMRRVLVKLSAVDDALLIHAVSGMTGKGDSKDIFAANQVEEQLAQRTSRGLSEPFSGIQNSESGT